MNSKVVGEKGPNTPFPLHILNFVNIELEVQSQIWYKWYL